MAAMEWDEPGMKRNKNVRFRMGQGSNTVSYYPPQSALEVGRNPSGYNPNQLPALRPSGAIAIRPSMVPATLGETVLDRNFNLGNSTEVMTPPKPSRSVAAPKQISYNMPTNGIVVGDPSGVSRPGVLSGSNQATQVQVNPRNIPAVRQSGLPTVTSRGALPSVLPPQTGFQMGTGSPVEISSVARPVTPHLQIGYDGPRERISLGQVRQNLNKGKFVGPPTPEGYSGTQAQAPLPNEGFVGPKNIGAFAPKITFRGSHAVDPSGSLAGELYRRLSKSTGRYIPGLEQMWGNQPNADEWVQNADDSYWQARSGLKIHPMNTQYKNHGMAATSFPAISPEQRAGIVDRQTIPQQESNVQDVVYGKTPGSAIIKDAITGKVLAQGSGPATGGFARNEESRLKDVAAEEARVNSFWADAAKQRAMETTDRQNSMMTQLDSAIRSGNQEQTAMLTNALKGVGAIQPMNYGSTENQLAEARTRQAALPYIGPKAEAETGLQNAQAGYYQTKNPTELGVSRSKDLLAGYLAKAKQGGKEPTLSEMIKLKELRMVDPQGYEELMQQINKG